MLQSTPGVPVPGLSWWAVFACEIGLNTGQYMLSEMDEKGLQGACLLLQLIGVIPARFACRASKQIRACQKKDARQTKEAL